MTTIHAILFSLLLATSARVTYYGPSYHGGELTASGRPYDKLAMTCALGPRLLQEAREKSGEEWPIVRLCLKDRCYDLRVTDTGSEGLEIDLPDKVWQEITGEDPSAGVVYGAVALPLEE